MVACVHTHICPAKDRLQKEPATGLGDIDFCLELLHSDIINGISFIIKEI